MTKEQLEQQGIRQSSAIKTVIGLHKRQTDENTR